MNIEKLPNETEFEYHKRLVYGKLIDGTLADIDYSELASQVYGKEYSSDVARRMFYGSRNTLELMDRCCTELPTRSDIDKNLQERTREFIAQKQAFYDQRREYNKLVAIQGRLSNIEDRLVEAANRLLEESPLYPSRFAYEYKDCDNEAVLLFSDWHYGAIADNVWNKYDTDICKQRVKDITIKAIQRIKKNKCNRVHLFLLGDLAHGAIHNSARVASEELVADQIMNVAEIVAQTISEIADNTGEVIVYHTYGNHLRTVQDKRDSIHRDNMERIIPWWLNQRLALRDDVFITKESENELIFADVCGYGICATHGDLDSLKQSPKTLFTLFAKKFGKQMDYLFLADKHHFEEVEELGIESFIMPCLCGSEDFANDHRKYSTPGQAMFVFNKEEGKDEAYILTSND